MSEQPTCTIQLTSRELTLIRVACFQRLDRLKNVPNEIAEQMHASYEETRELLNGKLWAARAQLPSNPTGESE